MQQLWFIIRNDAFMNEENVPICDGTQQLLVWADNLLWENKNTIQETNKLVKRQARGKTRQNTC